MREKCWPHKNSVRFIWTNGAAAAINKLTFSYSLWADDDFHFDNCAPHRFFFSSAVAVEVMASLVLFAQRLISLSLSRLWNIYIKCWEKIQVTPRWWRHRLLLLTDRKPNEIPPRLQSSSYSRHKAGAYSSSRIGDFSLLEDNSGDLLNIYIPTFWFLPSTAK